MIELTGVTKQYPDGTVAVEEFSAQFPPHRTTVLLGSSGCGKTTILRMVNRMVDATRGTITIDGEDIARRDVVALRRSIGYVMQNAGLLPHRRVIDNIATVPLLNKVPSDVLRYPLALVLGWGGLRALTLRGSDFFNGGK